MAVPRTLHPPVHMTDLWRDPDDIIQDFASGDAERIRLGLAGLREFSKDGDEVDLPAIDLALLEPFGSAPPEQVVLDFATLLADYRSFVPPPTATDKIVQLVELSVRHGLSRVIHETELVIQRQPDPAAATRLAMTYLGERGLHTAAEIVAARQLVFYLLEAKPEVRRAVGYGLAAWPSNAATRQIIAGVLPLIDPDQRASLTL